MGLFSRSGRDDKRIQDAAGKAESERLAALSVTNLAALMLPAFGPDGPGKAGAKEIGSLQVGIFLMREFPRGNQFIKPLLEPIKEGVQVLETAGLIRRTTQSIGGSTVKVTRLGLQTIADGSVQDQLNS